MKIDKSISLIFFVSVSVILAFFFNGCSKKKVSSCKKVTPYTIAVLPISSSVPEIDHNDGICPICKNIMRKGKIEKGGEWFLTELFLKGIESMGCYLIIPPKDIEGIVLKVRDEQIKRSEKEEAIEVGKEVLADAVFVGYLFRYEERVGYAYSIKSPASLGFCVHLIRVKDGKIIWKASFYERQLPLFENLLRIGAFIRRKGRWLKVEELARCAVDAVLKTFPRDLKK